MQPGLWPASSVHIMGLNTQTHLPGLGKGAVVKSQVLQGLVCGEQKGWSIYPIIKALTESKNSLGMKTFKKNFEILERGRKRKLGYLAKVGGKTG